MQGAAQQIAAALPADDRVTNEGTWAGVRAIHFTFFNKMYGRLGAQTSQLHRIIHSCGLKNVAPTELILSCYLLGTIGI